jgi:hypothetical protein
MEQRISMQFKHKPIVGISEMSTEKKSMT